MSGILTGKRGMAGTVLTIVIVWALAAVLMLTGTLQAARRINADVKIITPEVNDIGTDTRGIALAKKVANKTKRIERAATPLVGRLDDTLKAAKGIDTKVVSILKTAGTINDVVKSINGNVLAIGSTVAAINGNVQAINSNAQEINTSVRDINASAVSINADANSISASVNGIDGSLKEVLATGAAIDVKVAGINRRANIARRIVIPAGADLENVRQFVMRILSHANAIDCSNLIKGGACDRTR